MRLDRSFVIKTTTLSVLVTIACFLVAYGYLDHQNARWSKGDETQAAQGQVSTSDFNDEIVDAPIGANAVATTKKRKSNDHANANANDRAIRQTTNKRTSATGHEANNVSESHTAVQSSAGIDETPATYPDVSETDPSAATVDTLQNDQEPDPRDEVAVDAESSTAGLDPSAQTIVGRVYDAVTATPLAGIVIDVASLGSTRSSVARVRTGSDGSYSVAGLKPGDYQLRTEATRRYPSRTVIGRAGFGAVNIELRRGVAVEVFGTVTSTVGSGVRGARVAALNGLHATTTDGAGRYRLTVPATDGAGISLLFSADGFDNKNESISRTDFGSDKRSKRNVVLARTGTAGIQGTLTSESGAPIAGIAVSISSTRLETRYNGASDANGRYAIRGIRAGDDYVLTVRGGGKYKNTSLANVEIAGPGTTVDLSLQELGSARVSATVLDPVGNPVPGLNLIAISAADGGASKQISTDDFGRFVIESIAPGAISFVTRSEPQFMVNGLTVAEFDDVDVNLIVDHGDYQVFGTVAAQEGGVIASANVSMRWERRDGSLTSVVNRTVKSNRDGEFSLDGLGAGPHRLVVRAVGYHSTELDIDPANQQGNATVRLKRL